MYKHLLPAAATVCLVGGVSVIAVSPATAMSVVDSPAADPSSTANAAPTGPSSSVTPVPSDTDTHAMSVTPTAVTASPSTTATATATTANTAPVAHLTLSTSAAEEPEVVRANAAASTDDQGVVRYTFSWGDGTPGTDTTDSAAEHQYKKAGHFTVAVSATDAEGAQGKATAHLNITAPPITPAITSRETIAQARAAIRLPGDTDAANIYPKGDNATPPAGKKYVPSGRYLLHLGSGIRWLRTRDPIAKGSRVSVEIRAVTPTPVRVSVFAWHADPSGLHLATFDNNFDALRPVLAKNSLRRTETVSSMCARTKGCTVAVQQMAHSEPSPVSVKY